MPELYTRPAWDSYFLAIAHAVALRVDCRRRRVGCVIVDGQKRIVATGYNGTAPGKDGCLSGACPRGHLSYTQQPEFQGYENCIAVHAEVNALLWAKSAGETAYVTAKPCPACSNALIAAGITRVVCPPTIDD